MRLLRLLLALYFAAFASAPAFADSASSPNNPPSLGSIIGLRYTGNGIPAWVQNMVVAGVTPTVACDFINSPSNCWVNGTGPVAPSTLLTESRSGGGTEYYWDPLAGTISQVGSTTLAVGDQGLQVFQGVNLLKQSNTMFSSLGVVRIDLTFIPVILVVGITLMIDAVRQVMDRLINDGNNFIAGL